MRKNSLFIFLFSAAVLLCSCGEKRNAKDFLIEEAMNLLNTKEYVLNTKAKLSGGAELTLGEGGMPVKYRFVKKSDNSFLILIEKFKANDAMPFTISLEIEARATVSKVNKGWVEFKGEGGVAKNVDNENQVLTEEVSVVGKINPQTKEINFKIDYKVGPITTVADVLDSDRVYADELRIYLLRPRFGEVFNVLPENTELKTSLYKGTALRGEENTPRKYFFKKIDTDSFSLDMANFKFGKMPASIGFLITVRLLDFKNDSFLFEGEKGQMRFGGMDWGKPKGTVRGSINPETKEIVFDLNFGAMDFVGKVKDQFS